ncbi:MAG TPA: hypothetical protein PLL78_11195 [Fimbriimonadaceae bacterium]|nr:hypothetical protein [Fimbriimonadaceae bacterium]HRJ97241.1 hypothetical protein [Fimbriimonadaceae bacterium]
MIVCHLTKPESTLDQVRKAHPKLKPTDAALIASSLVLSGRYALAVYDEKEYSWPEDIEKLTKAMLSQMKQIQETVEVATKRAQRVAIEEEPVEVRIGLLANYAAGEKLLGDRKDLKTLLGDILKAGVEFQFGPQDIIGWQWALDRANWHTLTDGELTRRVKLKATFQDNSVGVELGASGTRKRVAKPKPAPAPVPDLEDEEPAVEAEAPES